MTPDDFRGPAGPVAPTAGPPSGPAGAAAARRSATGEYAAPDPAAPGSPESGDATDPALLPIGEVARRAGVTVKTVRFYSDRGLLPEAARSAGGHRLYGRAALERLRLIRSLRALDLPVPAIRRILAPAGGPLDVDEDVLADALAGQLRDIGSHLAALRWREAALRLVQECPPAERADRLRLIAAVPVPPSTAVLVRFWRRWLPPRMPARLVAAILDQAVPQPPADPSPADVLAFAGLHAVVSSVEPRADKAQPVTHRPGSGHRPAVLYAGLSESYALTTPHLRAGDPPRPGPALDSFVAAYAASLSTRDTPAFRRGLAAELATEPRLDIYWHLTARLTTPATPGAAHTWLREALRSATAAGEGQH